MPPAFLHQNSQHPMQEAQARDQLQLGYSVSRLHKKQPLNKLIYPKLVSVSPVGTTIVLGKHGKHPGIRLGNYKRVHVKLLRQSLHRQITFDRSINKLEARYMILHDSPISVLTHQLHRLIAIGHCGRCKTSTSY